MSLRSSGTPVQCAALLPTFVLVVLLSGCARTMMETPLVYRDSSTPTFGDLAPELREDPVQVHYVTDRKPASSDTAGSLFYGSERSTSGVLGIADVRIGRGAVPGENSVETGHATPQVVSVEELVRFPATPYLYKVDDRGQIAPDSEVAAELQQATAASRREIVRRLALTPKKEVFVFVHGVGNQFDDALIAATESWHFLGREGVPIAYSWPAGAEGLLFYTIDRESGEFTVLHFKQFLRILSEIPEVEKIHILAHSRGTDVSTSALRELVIASRAAGQDPRVQYKIENLVLLAADLDLEVAMQRLIGEALGPAFGRVTIYTNANDSALATARSLFKSRQRVGDVIPTDLTPRQREIMQHIANLDIIVYEGSGGGIFKHSYYRDPVAASDILMLLRYGWPPGEGQREALEQIGPNIWRIRAP